MKASCVLLLSNCNSGKEGEGSLHRSNAGLPSWFLHIAYTDSHTSLPRAVRVRRLAQGLLDVQLGGAGDRTSKLLVTSQPSRPAKLLAPLSLQDSLQQWVLQWTLQSGPALVAMIQWWRHTSCQRTNTLMVSQADMPPSNSSEQHTPTAHPRLTALTALKQPHTILRNYWTHTCTHKHKYGHKHTITHFTQAGLTEMLATLATTTAGVTSDLIWV